MARASLDIVMVRQKLQQAWSDLLAKEHLRDLKGLIQMPCLPFLRWNPHQRGQIVAERATGEQEQGGGECRCHIGDTVSSEFCREGGWMGEEGLGG